MVNFTVEYKGQKEKIQAHNLWQARNLAAKMFGVPKARERFIIVKKC